MVDPQQIRLFLLTAPYCLPGALVWAQGAQYKVLVDNPLWAKGAYLIAFAMMAVGIGFIISGMMPFYYCLWLGIPFCQIKAYRALLISFRTNNHRDPIDPTKSEATPPDKRFARAYIFLGSIVPVTVAALVAVALKS